MEVVFLAVLFLLMAAALGSGFPVAFALPGAAIGSIGLAAGAGLLFEGDSAAYFASGGPLQWLTAGVTNFRSIYWEAERDTLIAIPLFIFMGIMLQRSKIAEDLLVTMAQLFGPVPGGLGISVVFVGALLAATTGIVGATVVAMGLISLPAMMRSGYSNSLSTGAIAASGTLGQIIPPSIVLIILADQLASATDQAGTARSEEYKAATGELSMPSEFAVVSTSAGDMFLGAFAPGLLLVALYMGYILVVALIRPSIAPAVPYDGRRDAAFWGKVALTLIPPLTLIVLVLGSIIAGIATVNQAGAIGAAGAMVMAGYRLTEGKSNAFVPALLGIVALIAIFVVTGSYDVNVKNVQTDDDFFAVVLAAGAVLVLLVALTWSAGRVLRIENTMQGVMIETAKTTSLVFIILLGAAMLTAAFRAFGGEEIVKEFLNSLPGGFWTQFIIVMAVIFVLGFFLDFIEIAVVVVPIVAPILLADPSANISAVWLGVMIGLNIQTSFLTPPFGFALFYLRGVAPKAVRTVQMYIGVIPFISLQLLALVIVGLTPQLVNYLPNRVSLLADTAPPPRNPRLQLCLEDYVAGEFAAQEPRVRAAIETARGLDLSGLPEDIAEDVSGAFDNAEAALTNFAAIGAAEAALEAADPGYRPIHVEVRGVERVIRREEAEIEELMRRRDRDSDVVQARIAELEADIERLRGEIPEEWEAARAEFLELIEADQSARNAYRRASDRAFAPITEVATLLEQTDQLAALEDEVRAIVPMVEAVQGQTEGFDSLIEEIERVRDLFDDLEGVRPITGPLGDARRALRGRRLNPETALEEAQAALTGMTAEIAWRREAAGPLANGLNAYAEALQGTIGLRSLDRMPRDVALSVAACNAGHRDISLRF